MSRIDARLARLERQITGELSAQQQLALAHDALYDRVAAERFAALRARGEIIPLIGNLYDLEVAGPVSVSDTARKEKTA